MNKIPMKPYYDLLNDIMQNGNDSDDRTGVGTRAVFGRQIRFDLRDGFPLLPGKFTPFKLVAAELLWFLSGSTNNEDLRKLNQSDKDTIWEGWTGPGGDLGPIYGYQWRHWNDEFEIGVDQIAILVDNLRNRPFSRRHIVSAWNPTDLPDEDFSPQNNAAHGLMALAPCHMSFQMQVRKLTSHERHAIAHKYGTEESIPQLGLSCHMYQRSADTFLGVPFNIASYALLTEMIAHVTGYAPLELIISFGDVHIYRNHVDQVSELLSRDLSVFELPRLKFAKLFNSIDDFKSIHDFELVGYKSHPSIKAPVAI